MDVRTVEREVLGPWSAATSRRFWEGFAPNALPGRPEDTGLATVFRVDRDWSRAETRVVQDGATATITVTGDGDLDAAVDQVARFLSLDVDARDWPEVGRRDPVIGAAQRALPGLRPCGFHSPYEAAGWAVLSQRVRVGQAARLRDRLVAEHGDDGAFPAPDRLLAADLDLPGPKARYLRAVARAALEGRLDGEALRTLSPGTAVAAVRDILGIGPFAADLIVLRGANAPDALPGHEPRLEAVIADRYGPDASLAAVAEAWRPFRTWACVHLRALGEQGDDAGHRPDRD